MAQYPSFNAGQRITAGLLQSVVPVVVMKPATTSRLNTVTPTDDPDLTFSLAANAVYFVEFLVRFSASSVAGASSAVVNFRTAWTVPSGASGTRSSIGPGSLATDASADNIAMHAGIHGYNSVTLVYGGRNVSVTNQLFVTETAVLTTSSAGTCAFQWSQGTANATYAASVYAGSFMRITRLA